MVSTVDYVRQTRAPTRSAAAVAGNRGSPPRSAAEPFYSSSGFPWTYSYTSSLVRPRRSMKRHRTCTALGIIRRLSVKFACASRSASLNASDVSTFCDQVCRRPNVDRPTITVAVCPQSERASSGKFRNWTITFPCWANHRVLVLTEECC